MHFPVHEQEKSIDLRNELSAGMPDSGCALEDQTELMAPAVVVPVDQVIGCDDAAGDLE
ncbi:MAG: hypothetical protein JO313_10105 [Verrucomicrobia bacterium]|nr:hypothetical protein [Verrucomicrobiota bacterium]